MSKLEIKEGVQAQGSDEEIVYTLTTTNWGSSPSSPVPKVYLLKKDGGDEDVEDDVTSTVMPTGAASVDGDVITWPTLKLLTRGRRYRFEMKFTVSGNVLESHAIIECER